MSVMQVWFKVKSPDGTMSADEVPVELKANAIYHDLKQKIKEEVGLSEPLLDLKIHKRNSATDELEEPVKPRDKIDPSLRNHNWNRFKNKFKTEHILCTSLPNKISHPRETLNHKSFFIRKLQEIYIQSFSNPPIQTAAIK